MDLTALFASLLRHFRDARGLSQEALADQAGLDRTYVSQLERGLKSPTLTSIEKLATCLGINPAELLQEIAAEQKLVVHVDRDYHVRSARPLTIRRGADRIPIDTSLIVASVDGTHKLIDQLYQGDLDIAMVLGMRNLSAFVGELVAAAILKSSDEFFARNPHQDGYPDLLLMDPKGKAAWDLLEGRLNEKRPFSPFAGGGIEVKATCGSVPTPANCRGRKVEHPGLGESRIHCLKGYDWKAHHRETNNLVGVLWDFIDARPRIAGLFYSDALEASDWGSIVHPKEGGGRTTSVSIMTKTGIRKMYDGWICVLKQKGYGTFLNRRNGALLIPND